MLAILDQLNGFSLTLIILWLCASAACFGTKNSEPIQCATIFSVIAGIGYFLYIMRPS